MQHFYMSTNGQNVVRTNPKSNGRNLIFSSQGRSNYVKNHLNSFLFILSLFLWNVPDLVSQTCTCPGTNLVQNHSFENGTTNWSWSAPLDDKIFMWSTSSTSERKSVSESLFSGSTLLFSAGVAIVGDGCARLWAKNYGNGGR